MFQTAFTLTLTQFARSLSLPERLQKTPVRNLALEALRQRNTALDAVFYDVKTISPEEAFYISDSLAAEGSILIVPPTGGGSLTLCDTLEEFVLRGGRDVHVLAVAGVGNSALGSAAFARNVADAVGELVAVVVSGYGLGDVVLEGLGGHFLFGHMSGLRHSLQLFDELWGRPKLGAANLGGEQPARSSLDAKTVSAMLMDPQLSFSLLTGHSKGNLVLSEALHELGQTNPARAERLAATTRIVTFGARIAMPPIFKDVIHVIGEWDWFGEMNSRRSIAADRRIPRAGHHTNTELAGHVPVTSVLREIAADHAADNQTVAAPSQEQPVEEKDEGEPRKNTIPRRVPSAKKTKVTVLTREIMPEISHHQMSPPSGPENSKPH